MAIIIDTVSSDTFSLNGTTYNKIYQPLKKGDTHVGIYNTFDTRFQLLDGNHYNEFVINSTTYVTQATCIEALLDVVYAPVIAIGGSGVVTSVFGRDADVAAAVGDYSAFYSQLAHTHTFAEITSKPTTIAGYGITDTFDQVDADALYLTIGGTAANSQLLDSVNSTQFVRSDVADTVAGILTHSARPAFNGGTSGVSSPFTVDSTQVVSNLNADLVDGIQGSSFLRSDANDIKTAGYLRMNDSLELQFGTGNDSNIFHNGSHTYMDLITGNFYIRDNTTTRVTIAKTTGNITAGAFFESSDIRLKKDIQPISETFRSFEYNAISGRRYGVIAQEIEFDHPELVETNAEGFKSVNMIDLLCLKVAELENEISLLKGEI